MSATVIAVGGPKGGIGKTTVAVNLAVYASRWLGLRVLLVDADPNRSSVDIAHAAGDAMPFDTAEGNDHGDLVRLQRLTAYDVVVVDLPGAREAGALRALLAGAHRPDRQRRPAVDLLVCPTRPELMDIRPLRRVLIEEIEPLVSAGLRYRVVLVRVPPNSHAKARRRQAEIRDWGFAVAATFTRHLTVHDKALEEHKALIDMVTGGRRSIERAAEREYRDLAAEILQAAGIDASKLDTDDDPPPLTTEDQ